MKTKKRLYPLPEAIDGAKWDVHESAAAMTDTKARTMFVPATNSLEHEYLRSHETAHARITPKIRPDVVSRKNGITVEAIQTCEDLRVNSFLGSRHIDTHGSLGSQDLASAVVITMKEDHRKLGSLLVASINTRDFDLVCHATRVHCDREFADSMIDCVCAVREMFEKTCAIVASKARYKRKSSPLSDVRGFRDVTVPVARLFDTLFPVGGDFDAGDAVILRRAASNYSAGRPAQWGKLLGVRRARMSRSRKELGRGGKSWRDEGAVPVAPYRLIIDGRIFNRKRRLKGGTVLIDCSGSMSLNSDDIARIIEVAPGAVVAAYSGRHCDGLVHIVAERGRMTSPADLDACRFPGGNIIDGPALRWLASMPGPRVWVSDGWVTGVDDNMTLNLVQDATAICRQGSITRVERPDDAAKVLK